MNELDEAWAQMLQEAERRARASGRSDIAAYLTLRRMNDEARRIGVDWLLQTFAQLAGDANRMGAGLRIERTEEHRFQINRSTMVGALLTVRAGSVRAVRVEAGWPRTPADGIVPNGGLARARVSHFGDPRSADDLLLVRQAPTAANSNNDTAGTPQWFALEPTGECTLLTIDRLNRHITKLKHTG